MRYLCVHCDHRFEFEGAEAPSRCPSCMRATGVQSLGDEAKKPVKIGPAKSRGLVIGLCGLGLLAAGGGAYALLSPRTLPSLEDVSPWSERELLAVLSAQQVDAGGLEKLLLADDAVEAFAEQARGDSRAPEAQAKAILEALRGRAKALAFVSWSLGEPRASAPWTAAETAKRLRQDNARAELYPLELAALMVSALRSLDVPAQLAELIEVPDRRKPLDGAGYLGYFVVALPAKDAGAPLLFDPFGGLPLSGSEKYTLISDAAAVGAALSLRAIYEVAYAGDPRSALNSSSHALKLSGSLPAVRTARGVIVLSGKMLEQGLQEFAAASQMRADAPRLHNLASAKLMLGDFDGASSDLARALEKSPDFAAAQATLGAIHMLRGDNDAAKVAFDAAERLAPDLSLVQWAKAEFLLRSGDRTSAIEHAREALAQRPSFDAKVRYAVILRQAGRYEDMRVVAHELVAFVPEYRKSEVRELVTTLLGPTALDPVDPEPSSDALADVEGPDLNLKLGADSKMLGPTESEAAGSAAATNDAILMLGDPKKLRLGGASDRLKLNLGD